MRGAEKRTAAMRRAVKRPTDKRKVAVRRALTRLLAQLAHFGVQQALSCVFPVVIFASLALTRYIPLPLLPRYDWLLVICLLMQWWMLRSGLETKDEMKVIALFHLIGLALEIFKVHMGSWSYPEPGYFKVFGVPLYSGFMYASVASYMCQAWRRLRLELVKWPPFPLVVPLAAAIYLNFFTHHYWVDIRWWLTGLVFIVFWRSRVLFEVNGSRYRMPVALSFVLIGFFIWVAENIATFFGAWQYPDQAGAWRLVHTGKLSSWFLLVIVSFLIVATLKLVKGRRPRTAQTLSGEGPMQTMQGENGERNGYGRGTELEI
ncbi:uncharacterized integral membrane protein [Thermobacillus composti KWC4]|uniref:Uncharacterized integral membrane protein n=1 Tax=Thermobacillus composti (strain DSM 18247 / JCM 13945 / KWC4) TaxID=717605 RepID=L0EBQ9_THECK|nr:uncharacterized integral membrane protein [Thermobacillus composti KWC4]